MPFVGATIEYDPGMARPIVIRHSVLVRAPMDLVYRFTQDYAIRPTWDASIRAATVLTESPSLQVRITMRGGHEATFVYKADRDSTAESARARATSVSMIDIRSWLLDSGGGSWRYEEQDGRTRWTQVMSLSLKPGPVGVLLRPLVAWGTACHIRRAMAAAARRLEANAT